MNGNLSPVFLQKYKNTVERILHVPGNFTEPILEMAVVIDENLTKEQVSKYLPELLRTLKLHSETFRNVRLNVVNWSLDGEITNRIVPMSMVMLPGFYEDYTSHPQRKSFEKLVAYLKMYQARAKLIILLTDGKFYIEQEEQLLKEMQPFLDKKLMQVVLQEEELTIRYRFAFLI